MENVKIWIDGVQKDVFGLFYIFDSKYYFIYTEKELDDNDYVILYMTLVGKETKNTENGAIETGAMIGVEITNPEEQQKAQTAVSYIVEDKKNNTTNPQIQYLPMSMLKEFKVVSKKRFRLLKSIMEENFKLEFASTNNNVVSVSEIQPITPIVSTTEIAQPLASIVPEVVQNTIQEPVQPIIPQVVQPVVDTSVVSPEIVQPTNEQIPIVSEPIATQSLPQTTNIEDNVIIDYRSKYFEEQEKNKELQAQVDSLTQKLEDIKKVIN